MKVYIYNTLTRKKEEFVPIKPGEVSLYTCGPTVYHSAHIGNLRTYLFEDTLRRCLIKAGYKVKHVMNITDVGHLESDGDNGNDKMQIASKRESKSPWDIAKFYEERFFKDCRSLNIIPPSLSARVTDHIAHTIHFVQSLIAKGSTYEVNGNVYFDVSTFGNYYKLSRCKPKPSDFSRVAVDQNKKSQRDFVLWFSSSKYPNQIMKWESPWGYGFPGWHIECSAIAMNYLGEMIDIHCGGQDHIHTHHTNEIAQSESLTQSQWVNYWLHGAFLEDTDGKMSKSKGKFYTIDSLVAEGFHPLHFRFFCLEQGHYRKALKFNFDLLAKSRERYNQICLEIIDLKNNLEKDDDVDILEDLYHRQFWQSICDDLDTINGIKTLILMLKDKRLRNCEKLALIEDFDLALGLNLHKVVEYPLKEEEQALLYLRAEFRANRDYLNADKIRVHFRKQNILLFDQPNGDVLVYKECYYQSAKTIKSLAVPVSVSQLLFSSGFFKRMYIYSLVENRHESEEAQEEYDKRFGLVPYKP